MRPPFLMIQRKMKRDNCLGYTVLILVGMLLDTLQQQPSQGKRSSRAISTCLKHFHNLNLNSFQTSQSSLMHHTQKETHEEHVDLYTHTQTYINVNITSAATTHTGYIPVRLPVPARYCRGQLLYQQQLQWAAQFMFLFTDEKPFFSTNMLHSLLFHLLYIELFP